MGKSTKDKDRRAVVEQMRREQERSEKKRTYAIIAACAGVGVLIVGLALPSVLAQEALESRNLDAIGLSAKAADCQDIVTEKATGVSDHQPEGKKIFYTSAPPAFGPHYATPAPMSRKFYEEQDRPLLGTLLHNLEHGYTILWYDQAVAENKDQLAEVRAISEKFPSTNLEDKFVVAPWTTDDGKPFPGGAHVALTHWSMAGSTAEDKGGQGVWQYCAAPSGEAVTSFIKDYPYSDSPEPTAP